MMNLFMVFFGEEKLEHMNRWGRARGLLGRNYYRPKISSSCTRPKATKSERSMYPWFHFRVRKYSFLQKFIFDPMESRNFLHCLENGLLMDTKLLWTRIRKTIPLSSSRPINSDLFGLFDFGVRTDLVGLAVTLYCGWSDAFWAAGLTGFSCSSNFALSNTWFRNSGESPNGYWIKWAKAASAFTLGTFFVLRNTHDIIREGYQNVPKWLWQR